MTRLTYFPALREDELLYSALARFHRNGGGASARDTNVALFGRSSVRCSYDLPTRLGMLAERLPASRDLSAERLAEENTLLPYLTAFAPAGVRAALLRKQVEGCASLHVGLGLNASIVEPIRTLRFCPACRDAMMAKCGELWWMRAHQLPGVLVCHLHGDVLLESSATFWTGGQHGFSPATAASCPDGADPVAHGLDAHQRRLLHELASASARLLTAAPQFGSYEELTDFYRARLLATGLMRTPRHVDVPALVDAFRTRLGPILPLLPGVVDGEGRFDRWLLELVRTNRKWTHPLQHLLLRAVLDGRAATQVHPFGQGPWFCRNPVVDHGGAATVTSLQRLRTGARTVYTFECGCGYAYSRSVDADGRVGGPRNKRFGPTLDPALRELVAAGASLRKASDALGLHPRAVAAAALRLDLQTGWKAPPAGPRNGSSGRLSRAPRRRAATEAKPRAAPQPRVPWDLVDAELAEKVAAAARSIRGAVPPRQVVLRSIEMEIDRPNHIYVRRTKLPVTMAAVEAATEDLEEFQRRRLEWAFDELRFTSRLTVSAVLRKAGLKPVWKESAASMIAGHEKSGLKLRDKL